MLGGGVSSIGFLMRRVIFGIRLVPASVDGGGGGGAGSENDDSSFGTGDSSLGKCKEAGLAYNPDGVSAVR